MEKNKNLIVFDNTEGVFQSTTSLQDNFQRFMKMRKDLRKSNIGKSSNTNSNTNTFRDNPERINSLRQKFIQQAISYLGIPYRKRYLQENNPLYYSPIFLDCCGLVRQCISDLREDFGFVLGKWNQAYQYDVLPDEIEFKDLKKGDLIFYTATMNKEKGWKEQPHEMVHVEIYMGDESLPERTIAARDRFGVVEYFDTYKFESENYYDIKYHFKSIDNWLRGIHRNYCSEHIWHDEHLDNRSNKYSVFSEEDGDCGQAAEQMEVVNHDVSVNVSVSVDFDVNVNVDK